MYTQAPVGRTKVQGCPTIGHDAKVARFNQQCQETLKKEVFVARLLHQTAFHGTVLTFIMFK